MPVSRTLVHVRLKVQLILCLVAGYMMSTSMSAQSAEEVPEESEGLDEVTIIASRLQPVTLGLEVLDMEEYSPQVSWTEVLQSLRGKAVSRSGNRGALTQVRVRGAEADHLKILINGVPLNTSISEAHFGAISTVGITQIESLNGPRSTVWGSSALAGIVNLSAKPASASNQIYADTGSFGALGYGVDLTAHFNDLNLVLNLADRSSDGTNIARVGSEPDGFEQTTAHVGYENTTDNVTLRGFARRTNTLSQYDPIPRDGDRLTDTTNGVIGQTLSWSLNDASSLLVELSHTSTNLHNLSETVETNSWDGDLNRIALVNTHQLSDSHGFSLAIDHVSEDFRQRGSTSSYGDPNYDESMSTTGLATEYLFSNNGWQITASLRREDNSDYGGSTTWQSAVTRHADSNRLSYTVGVGIKNPTFIERYGFTPDSFVGNPNLEPERALEHQLAYARTSGQHEFTVALFHNTLTNEINGFAYDANVGQFTASNRDRRSKRVGMEVSHELQLSRGAIGGSVSYVSSKEGDEREIRRPKLLAHLGGRFELTNSLSFAASASYTSDQLDRDFSSFPAKLVTLDAYTLLRLSLKYQMMSRTTLHLDVDNVLDVNYENVFGFSTTGRTLNVGAKVRFDTHTH